MFPECPPLEFALRLSRESIDVDAVIPQTTLHAIGSVPQFVSGTALEAGEHLAAHEFDAAKSIKGQRLEKYVGDVRSLKATK